MEQSRQGYVPVESKRTPKQQRMAQQYQFYQNASVLNILVIDPNYFSQTWGPQDDVIMGGNSMSTISCEKERNSNEYHAVFKGEISLRNGGFCGMRTRNANPALNLAGFKGISLKTRSKQNYIYQINVKDSSDWNGITWSCDFEVKRDDRNWQEHNLSFDRFVPTWRGQIVDQSYIPGGKMQRNNIHSISVMLSFLTSANHKSGPNPKFKEGEFYLEFKNICGYN